MKNPQGEDGNAETAQTGGGRHPDNRGGGLVTALGEVESTLLWSERNLCEPRINCVEGYGIPTEPLDKSG